MIFEGIITYIGNKETVWQNALLKQSFIVQENTDKEYKNSLMVDVFKEKTDMLNDLWVWDWVKVSLSLRATEYNGRYFNNVSARKIEKIWWSSSAPKSSTKVDNDELPF